MEEQQRIPFFILHQLKWKLLWPHLLWEWVS